MKIGQNGEKIAETPEETAQLAAEAEAAAKSQVQAPTDIEKLIQSTIAPIEQARRAAEQRSRELEDRLNSMQSNNNRQQQQNNSPQITKEQFWENPVESMNTLIAAQVAPLNVAAEQLKSQGIYNDLKSSYRSNPGFPLIESFVDQFMQGKTPTHANMAEAIERAVGRLAMTNPAALSGPANNQQQGNNNQQQDPAIVGRIPDAQAHLRPSANNLTLNPKDTKPKRRELNEFEKRVVRETPGMTEDRYFELLESNNVVNDMKVKEKAK